MNIALVGFGNMGQEIERLLAKNKEHKIISISYKTQNSKLDIPGIKKADVAIDFTAPAVVVSTITKIASLGVPMVIGTTGWYEYLQDVKKIVQKAKTGLIYGQNFSVGANIFFKLTAYAAKLLSGTNAYDAFGIETHHTGKKDSPSGTARKLANVLLENYPQKKRAQFEKLDRAIRTDELHFVSVRGGRNFGRHEIVFDSPADQIQLIHQAWGRQGFAEGAIRAAEFIKNKKGVYEFGDLFGPAFVPRDFGEARGGENK